MEDRTTVLIEVRTGVSKYSIGRLIEKCEGISVAQAIAVLENETIDVPCPICADEKKE
jgi:hypothetical protein